MATILALLSADFSGTTDIPRARPVKALLPRRLEHGWCARSIAGPLFNIIARCVFRLEPSRDRAVEPGHWLRPSARNPGRAHPTEIVTAPCPGGMHFVSTGFP